MRKFFVFAGLLLCGLSFPFQGFSQYDQRRSLTVNNVDDRKGVASMTAYLDYAVRRHDNEIWIPVSYSEVKVNAAAGYWYKGKLYKDEVPGLMALLNTAKTSAPTVKFNVYYNNIKQETRSLFITERNNLGLLGDIIRLKATDAQLKNPAYRLEAVEMTGYNNSDWWYKAESLIETYERNKKDQADYKALIREGDDAFYKKNYPEALSKYGTATRHKLADAYASTQLEKVREAMKKEKSTGQFTSLMQAGEKAEEAKNYAEALRQYEAASRLGVDDSKASLYASRVRRTLDQSKRDEEEKLKQQQADIARKNKEAVDKLKHDKEEADRLLKKKDEELEKENEERLRDQAKKLKDEEKRLFEEGLKKQLAEQNAKWEQKKKEEKQKEEKEKADRRNADNKLLAKFKKNMQWDPEMYARLKTKADGFFNAGMQLKPYDALELKKEWWDMNHFMKDFREDLNEPRRQQAWKKCQDLLFEQEHQFDMAKYYYMEAIQYTDEGSLQYQYLMGRVQSMNSLLDTRKLAITLNRQGEEKRQENFKEARAWAVINRQRDNSVRATIAYQHLRQQYLYPDRNYKGPSADNAIQRQYNFEQRLNAADQQLRQDNAVTGLTSQLAIGALIDENKKANPYGEGAMGINLFAFTGGLTYPVVSNTEDNPDYVMASGTDQLSTMPFIGGFDWWIRRSSVWDLGLTGDLTFGVLPMAGYKNTYFSFGSNVKLNVGFKALKLALEADWHNRAGSYHYDQDVAMQDNQFWRNQDMIYTGGFNYSVLRVGGGLHIQYADEYNDGYLRLLLYAEKPSFYQGFSASKPVLSFGAQYMMKGGFTFNGSYAQNYPVAGTAKYMMRNYSNRIHWSFSVGKIWTLGKTH